jgi:hypothetical protein
VTCFWVIEDHFASAWRKLATACSRFILAMKLALISAGHRFALIHLSAVTETFVHLPDHPEDAPSACRLALRIGNLRRGEKDRAMRLAMDR